MKNLNINLTNKYEMGNSTVYDYDIALNQNKKGERKIKKQFNTNIVAGKEDKDIRLTYAGIDMEDYRYITLDEFIEAVEEADTWDFIDGEVYDEALKAVGLDYSQHEDPDTMWEDFLEAAKSYQ